MAELECVMRVIGDCAFVNTFDAAFRTKRSPQWPNRKNDAAPRYSLNAIRPVPEDILRRGYQAAGHLWCEKYWGSGGDLSMVRIRKGNGVNLYRFMVKDTAPVEALLYAAYQYPLVRMELAYIEAGPSFMHSDGIKTCIVHHQMDSGHHMKSTSPNRDGLTTLPDNGLWGMLL